MRRLTLILSDLYLPEEVASATQPEALALPQLRALLRLASGVEAFDDWRRWLAVDLGFQPSSGASIAAIAAGAFLPPALAANAWFATPVHLAARLDHVRLVDRGLLRLDAPEQAAWCEEFGRQFGPQYTLHAGGERTFLLTGLAAAPVVTVDPARLLDADVVNALPRGDGNAELRRLGGEIEMWMHGSALNERRARAGKPRLSTLWTWGGGTTLDPSAAAGSTSSPALAIHGGDPFIAGLARALGQQAPLTPPPATLAPGPSNSHQVMEFAPMSGDPQESLPRLDAGWFAAARHALRAGALDEVRLLANDRCFVVGRRAHWRFWRPQRDWFANLGVPGRDPKA